MRWTIVANLGEQCLFILFLMLLLVLILGRRYFGAKLQSCRIFLKKRYTVIGQHLTRLKEKELCSPQSSHLVSVNSVNSRPILYSQNDDEAVD